MQSISVPIKGLSNGVHSFDFTIGKEFFSKFGNEQIRDAEFSVSVEIQRFTTNLQVKCHSVGIVVVECDRCLEDLKFPVDVTSGLTVNFSQLEVEDNSDEVIFVDDSLSELDLNQEIYDYICLSLPLQKVHPYGECNPAVMQYLCNDFDKDDIDNSDNSYSPFESLKDLLNNNNN